MISQLVWKRLFKTQMLLASFMILNHFYGAHEDNKKKNSWKPHPKSQPFWNCREMKLQVKFTHACLTFNNLLDVLSLPQTHIYTNSGHKQLKSNTSINHNESLINSSDIHLETILKSATCWKGHSNSAYNYISPLKL